MNTAQPANKTAWKTGELLEWTTQFFTRAGIDEARLSAELLLAHALGTSRMALYTQFDQFPSPEKVACFRELVRLRKDHTPVAHLIGKAWFFSLELTVSADVLIPRPDTETLVEQAIGLVRANPGWETPDILDLCTGSGCIALALAKNLATARLIAADISPAALAVAEKNAAALQLSERIRWCQGDLLAAVQELSPPVKFDLIVSNPPYIPTTQIATLMPEVSRHEPRLALDGGPDGLAFYKRIATAAPIWLKPGGALMLETPFDQAVAVEAVVLSTGKFSGLRMVRDVAGHQRCLVAHVKPE